MCSSRIDLCKGVDSNQYIGGYVWSKVQLSARGGGGGVFLYTIQPSSGSVCVSPQVSYNQSKLTIKIYDMLLCVSTKFLWHIEISLNTTV